MVIIVGGILEKDGKYLLVQEAKKKCYGKWNIPAGHLDFGESLVQGAIREVKEETGCNVKPVGLLYLGNRILEDNLFNMVIFKMEIINENIEFDKNEILDVKWFEYEEIMEKMDDKLRGIDYIKTAIKNHKNNIVGSMDLVNEMDNNSI